MLTTALRGNESKHKRNNATVHVYLENSVRGCIDVPGGWVLLVHDAERGGGEVEADVRRRTQSVDVSLMQRTQPELQMRVRPHGYIRRRQQT